MAERNVQEDTEYDIDGVRKQILDQRSPPGHGSFYIDDLQCSSQPHNSSENVTTEKRLRHPGKKSDSLQVKQMKLAWKPQYRKTSHGHQAHFPELDAAATHSTSLGTNKGTYKHNDKRNTTASHESKYQNPKHSDLQSKHAAQSAIECHRGTGRYYRRKQDMSLNPQIQGGSFELKFDHTMATEITDKLDPRHHATKPNRGRRPQRVVQIRGKPQFQPHSQENDQRIKVQNPTLKSLSREQLASRGHMHHDGKGKHRGYVKGNKSCPPIPALTITELKALCELRDTTELVHKLYQRIKAFQRFLQLSDILQKPNIIDAIVYLLLKVSQSLNAKIASSESQNACQILGEVLTDRCAPFHLRLKVYVQHDLHASPRVTLRRYSSFIPLALCKQEAKVATVSNLFKNLLESLPESSWVVLPVVELVTFIQGSPNLYQFVPIAETISMLYSEMREQSQKTAITENQSMYSDGDWDNAEYRKIEILPKWEDVCVPGQPTRLRANIVNGCYTDWMHYYDVQFRLLREDFIAPLRRGVCGYIQGDRGRKLQDVKVYQNVRIFKPTLTNSGVTYEISFDVSRLKRCKWEHSKRLLFGSLLCLSHDNFNTVFFATVSDRKPENLRKGQLQIKFEEGARMVGFCSREHSVRFTMVESLAYFEASCHILRSLQTAEVATMPFTQYLVENECDDVSPPKYLTDQQYAEYDLSCLLEKDSKASFDFRSSLGPVIEQETLDIIDDEQRQTSDKLEIDSNTSNSSIGLSSSFIPLGLPRQVKCCFNILDLNQWPSHDDVELDESQLQAIQMALTQEIAVIQGPPGTGKTYVGLKIVDALLKNRDKWDPKRESPILVMCYTNHALDQFLEGILQQQPATNLLEDLLYRRQKPRIIRIGGRSRSEVIQKFNLELVGRNVHKPQAIYHAMKNTESLVEENAGRIIRVYLKERHHLQKSFLNQYQLLSVPQIVSQQHRYQLFSRAQSQQELDNALELWLGMCEVREIEISSQQDRAHKAGDQAHSSDMFPNQMVPLVKNYEDEQIDHVEEDGEQSSREDSEDEELIDIKGEAIIEQEARMTEYSEENFLPKQDLKDSHYNQEEKQKQVNHVFHDPTYSDSDSDTDSHSDSDSSSDSDYNSNTPLESEPIKESIKSDQPNHISKLNDSNHKSLDVKPKKRAKKTIKVLHVFPRPDIQNIVNQGLKLSPMTEIEVQAVEDIYHLNADRRWKLYNYWVSEFLKNFKDQLEVEFEEYNQLCKDRLEARRQADRFALETAEVIGMTTTGAAKYQHILHLVKPRIVIVEEAAEVLESHIVSALNAGTQHLILIGDHKQLRPKPNEYHLAKKYKLDTSLFERLVCNNFPHATLQIQHRMRPEIAQLVKPHIYEILLNHPTVEKYENVAGIETNLFFIQHDHPETEDENLLSHSNQHEARYLAALCKYLLQQGYEPSQITILVTYSGQLLKMRSEMPKKDFEGVRVCTVDNFQGEENDIILLSLVRSNSDNVVGFLREENRVCVALSRAKKGFYCIGNFNMLRKNVKLWEAIISDVESKNHVGNGLPLGCGVHPSTKFTACVPEDFRKNAPEGGCQRDCNFRLSCGHVCTRKCHTSDLKHENFTCTKPCMKKCPEGHPCPKLCYIECKCVIRVTRVMPDCGHEQEMYCHESPSSVKCMNPCDVICPNGHQCHKYCYQDCGECIVVVEREMPLCGHAQYMYCHQELDSFVCEADCEKSCKNGHPCVRFCGEECGDCEVPMEKTIAQCKHTVTLPCYKPPATTDCTRPCEKSLSCGHQCKNKCGQLCNSVLTCVEVVEKTLQCEHSKKMLCNQSPQDVVCDLPCEKILRCGHKCSKMCNEQCVTQCDVMMNKQWPCGHKMKRKCYQTENPEKYPCKKKCPKILDCGHQCPGKCSDVCAKQKCPVLVDKVYPCGHEYNVPCSSTLISHPCKMICSFILACGHRCEGECSQCYLTRFHQPCRYGMELRRFCGHTIQADCLDLVDTHPKKTNKCLAFCPHGKCLDDCSTECEPCMEPCQWTCRHHKCTKLCHEMCDRPPCNERCIKRLKCGHQCFGVCGEPCLSVCPDCHRKQFNKRFVATRSQEFDRQALYIQLPCTHIFTVKYLDFYTNQPRGKGRSGYTPVALLQCPKCEHALCLSYRYGNAMKMSFKYVNDVRVIRDSAKVRLSVTLLASRLTSLLRGYMVSMTITKKHSKKRGHNHKPPSQTGIQYKPLPQITDLLNKLQTNLKHQREVTRQEMYILHLIVDAIELLNITSISNLKTVPLTEIRYTRNISVQLSTYINYLLWVRNNMRSRLTTQMLQDLQSERYRLCLLTQYCLVCTLEPPVKDGNPDPLYEEKHFLQQCAESNLVLVSHENFKKYARSFERRYTWLQPGSCMPVDYEAVARAEEVTRPPVLKGNWWRCSRGHYFCVSLTMNDSTRCVHVCPKCT